VLEVLADLRAGPWFNFDAQGAQRWSSAPEGSTATGWCSMAVPPRAVCSGPGFRSRRRDVAPWGSLELDLTCSTGTAGFTPTEAGFPAGTLALVRLSRLGGLGCED
jgi:hypothetical protein